MEPNDIAGYIPTEQRPGNIIKAIGVGGGGNNAVDHMFRQGIENITFVNINTDTQALKHSCVPERITIGPGLGAGNDPAVAQHYAEENADRIGALFDDDTKMVFITAGMGGGTGTGAAPVVARIAKEHDMLTIGIVTIPFLFEGKSKITKALAGAEEMSKYVDALLVINNERLTEIYHDLDLVNGFAKADETLTTAARSISELINCTGHINLDFNDVNTTLRDGGAAIISTGFGEGEGRVTRAIQDALNSPLLKNRNIMGSKKLLFNLYFSREADEMFLMEEANELTQFVNSIDNDVDVIWGLAFDESLGNKVKITILAAGFDVSLEEEEAEFRNRPSRSPFPHRPKKKEEEKPISVSIEQKMRDEYGDKLNNGNERSRYIILPEDRLDDDMIIEILEQSPTLTRDRKVVERARSLNGPTQRSQERTSESSDSANRISFS